MNSMPGAGGAGGGAGGYGGGGPGGLPGGMPGGQQGGAPVDHQQQQQQMMMARQQHMAYMQQQQQAAAARGMMPPGMQQHPSMMQQQNMYGMQQQQQPGGGAAGGQVPMDAAAMQRYQQARQQHMQQMQQQQQPGMHQQQQMLEKLRNLPPEERTARLNALSANRGGAYPPGMHPMVGGHMGGPAQPGSSGMGGMVATSAAGAVGGGGGGLPSHYIKQEPLGAGAGAGGVAAGGASGGMMGGAGVGGGRGGHSGGAPHLMNVKQEQGLHSIKQEPSVSSSSSMVGHHPMQQQQQQGEDGSQPPHATMQHMQPQGMPVNMQQARMQQARQAAAMRGMSQQQAAAAAVAASMQGGAPSGQEMSVGQMLAAKQAAGGGGGGGGGHPQHMQQQPQSMQHMDMHQRMIYQQQHLHHQQQLQQQQGMSMAQMQAQHAARQQMGGATTAAAAAGVMGPPPMQQQQPQPAAAAAPAAPAVAPAPPPPDDQEEVKLFKKKVDALKSSHGSIVERFWNRATPGESMPKFITVCRDLFSGAMSYTRSNMNTVTKLELHLDLYLERQSVTAGILTALDSVAKSEKDAKERGEMEDVKPTVSGSSSSRPLPDPWPLDVRARRVRVPDGLSAYVRSKKMDARLISRRKRHADVMRDEEGLPLWSARRMRHEVDLNKELDELEKVDVPGEINGVPCKIYNPNLHSMPHAVVNSVPSSDVMEKALAMRRKFGNPFPNEDRMPEQALKELSVLQWRMITEDRQNADAGNFLVNIQIGLTAIPPLYVLIPGEYPKRPAAILFEKSFPKAQGPLRRLGEMMEARLATVPISSQGRITTIASVYKDACESFFAASRSVREQMALSRGPRCIIEQSPSPLSSASSSTSTSPAEQPQPTETPPTMLHPMPVLNHPPATYRPQPKFHPSVEGGAKSRMVY